MNILRRETFIATLLGTIAGSLLVVAILAGLRQVADLHVGWRSVAYVAFITALVAVAFVLMLRKSQAQGEEIQRLRRRINQLDTTTSNEPSNERA